MIVRLGQRVQTKPLILVSFAISLEYAVFKLEGSSIEYLLPLNMAELDIGKYGSASYIHPTQLPFSNTNLCMWKDKKKRLVIHNRTNTVCKLLMKEDFWVTGNFTLVPLDSPGETKVCQSLRWNKNLLRPHLEGLKGKSFELKLKVVSMIYKDMVMNQVLLTRITSSKCTFVLSSIDWDTFFPIPMEILEFNVNVSNSK